jgi:hypothetical protein
MNYHFDSEHACAYGVNEAILIHNFLFWIRKNKANGKHFHDGRTWTYNSVTAWMKLFPFWSRKQLRNVIESLLSQGVIVSGEYNENPFDRTKWYAFSDENAWGLGQFDAPQTGNMDLPETTNVDLSEPTSRFALSDNSYTDKNPTDKKLTDRKLKNSASAHFSEKQDFGQKNENQEVEVENVSLEAEEPKEKSCAKKEKVADPNNEPPLVEPPLPFGDAFAKWWATWLAYRKERRLAPYKPIGLKHALDNIAQISGNSEAVAVEIIKKSIANNYQGLFPLETQKKSSHAHQPSHRPFQFSQDPNKFKPNDFDMPF